MKRSFGFAVALFLVFAAGAISADVVKVTAFGAPGPGVTGWVSAGIQGSHSKVLKPGLTQIQPKGCPGPRPPGSVYGKEASIWDGTPTSSWLGTNDYNGTPLADITKLEYSVFMYRRGCEPSVEHAHYASQPFQIQIVTKTNTGNYRYLMYRPWGMSREQPHGSEGGEKTMVWRTHDAVLVGTWYEAWTQTRYEDGDGTSGWDKVLAAFPGAVIEAVSGIGDTWPPTGAYCPTPTGCSLNFVLGARANSWNPYANDDPPGAGDAWWRESYNCEGSMDNFTIGIRQPDGSVVETTYDFDVPLPFLLTGSHNYSGPMPVYGMNNRALIDNPYRTWWIPLNSATDPDWMKWSIANRNSAYEQIWGVVLFDNAYNMMDGVFSLDDGSGIPVRVHSPGCYVVPGEFYSLRGTYSPPYNYPIDNYGTATYPKTFHPGALPDDFLQIY